MLSIDLAKVPKGENNEKRRKKFNVVDQNASTKMLMTKIDAELTIALKI